MKNLCAASFLSSLLLFCPFSSHASESAEFVHTPYTAQNVVFDFYFDEPSKIATALYWLRSLLNTLSNEPYNITPDFNDIKVVIHGTEIVTLAQKNYPKYKAVVERMRYYAEFGVEFKICAMAAKDYGYDLKDFYEFVDVVPSSITELAHWQLQGYALITPQVPYKKHAIEDIR
ncbi:MAG: DsrE family protein [Gammaproteobacteria bacterium]|nr:DsrE family protein [Gammaproteobacteria bacterium]